MARPSIRVDLSVGAADFQRLAIEPGRPLLEKWNATVSLLGEWLGRFAAEPVWEDDTVGFYVRDDEGSQLADVTCLPTTEADLRGPLKAELRLLKDRLRKVEPPSGSAQTLHQFLCQGLLDPEPGLDFVRFNCQFFKYRDVDGRWRLVWCYGYRPTAEAASGDPVVCSNPECHQLALPGEGADRACPRCGAPLWKPVRARRRRTWIKAFVLLLLLVSGGVALYAYARPMATLTGRVVRSADEKPVAGAEIQVEGMALQTVSDDKGLFRMERLPPGAATIRVSAPGFREQSMQAELAWAKEISVQIRLAGALPLRGKVVHVVGEEELPVAKAQVALAGMEGMSAETDEHGMFTFADIPPGPVKASVSAPGFRSVEVDATAMMEGSPPLRVVLAGDGEITGTVVYAADETVPIDGAEVAAEGIERSTARTGPDGGFTLQGVPPVPVQVRGWARGFRRNWVTARADQTPVCIPLTGDAVVNGTVIRADTNQPVPGTEIRLAGTPFKARADDRGSFRLEGACSGPAQIVGTCPGWSGSVAMDLPADQETSVQIVLTGGATVRGRVVSAADGQPVPNAAVAVATTRLQASTDAQGQFALPGVPVAKVTVLVSAEDHFPKTTEWDLVEGEQTLEDIELSPAGTVVGRVVRALDGNPVEGAEVTIVGGEGTARTGPDGTFTISGLPVGPAAIGVVAAGFRAEELQPMLLPGRQTLEDIRLTGDTAVSGVTLDAGNRQHAVPNASVEFSIDGYQGTLTSANNGGFTVGDVPSGRVEVTARAPGYRDAHVQKTVSPRDAWIEVPMARLIAVKGAVVEAGANRRPVAGATVRVSVGGMEEITTSAKNGAFSLNVPAGEADVRAQAAEFCDVALRKNITPKDVWIEIPMVRGTTLRGTVVNAVNNKPVPEATVTVKVGNVQKKGDTDSQGQFEVRDIPAGNAVVDIRAEGFEPAQLSHQAGSPVPLRAVLSPRLPPGEARIVLTWGERPRDLDGHLYGPLPLGGRFHVSFKQRTAQGVTLDVDAKEGIGPETITMRAIPGTYQYYVAHPENQGTADGEGLDRSEAQVRVYYKGAQPGQPFVIRPKAEGPVWHVFDIVVGDDRKVKIVPKNGWLRDLPAP